jgi:hypothetical protein
MRRTALVVMFVVVCATLVAPGSALAGSKNWGVPLWVNLRDTVHGNTPASQFISKTNGSHCQWLAPTARTLPYACPGHYFSAHPQATAKYRIAVGHAKRIFVSATFTDPEGNAWSRNGIPWTRSVNGRSIIVTVATPFVGSGAVKTIHVALRWG